MRSKSRASIVLALALSATPTWAAELNPYGFIRVDAIYDTVPMDNPQSPIVVFRAPEGFGGSSEFSLHPRLTRLGFDASGEEGEVMLDGKIEIDFQNGGRESREVIRMRHGYGTLHTGDFSLLFGQTWQTVSRLLPAANADTLMWGAGNTGDRSPQIRAGYAIGLGDAGAIHLESAVQALGTVHNKGQPGLNFGPVPGFEERLALELPLWDDAKPLHLAFGLHYAQEVLNEKTFGKSEFEQFGIFTEAQIPITAHGWLAGEFFKGKNLSDLRGGIGQGVNTISDKEIRTQGYWAEANIKPADRVRLAAGYGTDAPNRKDIETGYPVLNRAAWAVVQVTPVDDFRVGFEVLPWSTEYKNEAILNSLRFNLNLTWTL